MTTRTTFHAAVYLLVKKDNFFTFLKRHNTGWNDGNYTLPAGHVDGNEKLTTAVIREAKEEVGIDIDEKSLKLILTCHRKDQNEREYFDFYFETNSYEGELQNCEPHKCSEINFFKLDGLPENIVSPVKKSLEAINNGQNILELNL